MRHSYSNFFVEIDQKLESYAMLGCYARENYSSSNDTEFLQKMDVSYALHLFLSSSLMSHHLHLFPHPLFERQYLLQLLSAQDIYIILDLFYLIASYSKCRF